MKFLRIKITGCLNSFRQPDFHTYHKTLPLPSKTTIAGMVGSAFGISPDEVNTKWLLNNCFQIGIVGKSKGKANDLWQIRKYTDKHIKDFYSGKNPLPYFSAVLVRELLYNSEFTIYLHFDDIHDFELAIAKLKNPEWALSLGRDDELVIVQEVKLMNLEEKSDVNFFNTILPIDFSETSYNIDLDNDNNLNNLLEEAPISVKLPVSFSYSDFGTREANEFRTFTFIKNLPIKPKVSKGFYDDEMMHAFQIF